MQLWKRNTPERILEARRSIDAVWVQYDHCSICLGASAMVADRLASSLVACSVQDRMRRWAASATVVVAGPPYSVAAGQPSHPKEACSRWAPLHWAVPPACFRPSCLAEYSCSGYSCFAAKIPSCRDILKLNLVIETDKTDMHNTTQQ